MAAIETASNAHHKKLASGEHMPGNLIKPSEWLPLLESSPISDLRFGIHLHHRDNKERWDLAAQYYMSVFNWKVEIYKLMALNKSDHVDYMTGERKLVIAYSIINANATEAYVDARRDDPRSSFPTLYLTGECSGLDKELDLKFSILPRIGPYWIESVACGKCDVVVKLLN
jgi:hypothetical protein